MFDDGLYALLNNDQVLQQQCAGRIFEGAAPPDLKDYPCLAYTFVGGSADPTTETRGVITQRVEISAYSFDSADGAKDMAKEVVLAVSGWQQKLTSGVNVLDAILLNPGTDMVSEQRCFRRLVEFRVLYTI